MNKKIIILILALSHLLCGMLGFLAASITMKPAMTEENISAIPETYATENNIQAMPSEPEKKDDTDDITEETIADIAETTKATEAPTEEQIAPQPPVVTTPETQPPATESIVVTSPNEGSTGEYETDRDF